MSTNSDQSRRPILGGGALVLFAVVTVAVGFPRGSFWFAIGQI
jgi:hypothetical protein